jgi:glycosyltransferase involved in cell wall biosynthesis
VGKAETTVVDPRRTALFLSRIHPIKGLLELVDAWGQVRPAGWRMVIAGPDEGGRRAVVEARVLAQGLASDFAFVGAVDGAEKTALYQSADLFILPSFSENFGVVIAEALACGVPVITTKGTPWAGLQTHRCGWWIDLGKDALVDALREATLTPAEVRQEMGERGRIYATSTFDWHAIARDMLAVYQWILGCGDQPVCIQRN